MSADESAVKVNAWEIQSDQNTVLALAGHSSLDEIRRDREARAQELVTSLAMNRSSIGFEIGSGNGVVANIISGQCARLDCNDISASFLALARLECSARTNIRFFQTADYLAHLSPTTYDFGYSLNVFIHFNPFDIYHYLMDVDRVLKPSGVFLFDGCTLGPQTRDKFLEHASLYRADPGRVRGFLAFNDPEMICRVIEEANLELISGDRVSREGWMRFIVRKR